MRRLTRSALAPLLVVLAACQGIIGGDSRDDEPRDGPIDETPPLRDDCTDQEIRLQRQVGAWLENSCAHAGCHGPVGPREPHLAAANLPALVARGYFIPGEPDRGRILARIDPDDPLDLMPPTIEANDPETIAMVREWVEIGAPVACVEPPPLPATEPSSYDQEELFTCVERAPFAPEAAMLTNHEMAHRAGTYLVETALQSNPFPRSTDHFSTTTVGMSVNPTMLGLHLDVLGTSRPYRQLDRAARLGGLASRGGRGESSPYRSWQHALTEEQKSELECIFDAGRPAEEVLADDACKRRYVETMLEYFALQRPPTAREVDVISAFLDEELTRESDRGVTFDHVQDASLMLAGAFFRSALGDDEGQLTPDEWGAILAGTLSSWSFRSGGVFGRTAPELGWVQDFVDARNEGRLGSPAEAATFIREVLAVEAGYVGGVEPLVGDAYRVDLRFTETEGRDRVRRARHWLAPRLAGFFREFFDYADLHEDAKDDPLATSRYDDDRINGRQLRSHADSYQAARDGQGAEPGLEDQLDDFIARQVLEAEQEGRDVLEALLTGRTYRVPAQPTSTNSGGDRITSAIPSGDCDPIACGDGDSCCGTGESCHFDGFDGAGEPIGSCITGRTGAYEMASVYGLRPIVESEAVRNAFLSGEGIAAAIRGDASYEGRWVAMPEGERAGVLTHPAWLTAHASNDENGSSVILRGHWIREHLFCEDVAGLELVGLNAQFPEGTEDMRARDRMIATFGDLALPVAERTAPDLRCANGACHGRMNTLGMPFEVFNHAGFVRHDDHGAAPSGQSVIWDWPGRDEVAVDDAVQLTEMLATDPHVRRCFLRHVFRYFARRTETPADACVLAEMEAAYEAEGGSLLAAITALLVSEDHMNRQTGEDR